MGRTTIAIALSAVAVVAIVVGCSSSTGEGPADGSVRGQSDAASEASGAAACGAAGGQCLEGPFCTNVAPQDCGPGAQCCLDQVCADGQSMIVQASDYDQSCAVDSDCVAVSEGNACYPCALGCTNAAIRAAAYAQYQADVARTFAFAPGGCQAVCLGRRNPCCRAGRCRADSECPNPYAVGEDATDGAGDAPTDAGAE
jgi:hypothetical protein